MLNHEHASVAQLDRASDYESEGQEFAGINTYMDYALHYDKLINKARARERADNVYYETHHIVPRCMDGNDSLTNLVRLTPEEHYLAHLLLVKMYPNNDSLVYAANKMTVHSPTQKRNNKRYGWLKRRYQSVCKKRVGDKNPSYGKSWYYDPVTLSNGKFALGEEPTAWIKGRSPPYSTVCEVCGNKTHRVKARWCNECRPKKEHKVFKHIRTKYYFTDEEKLNALQNNDWHIRRALYSLGLSDSGLHYRKMRDLKNLYASTPPDFESGES